MLFLPFIIREKGVHRFFALRQSLSLLPNVLTATLPKLGQMLGLICPNAELCKSKNIKKSP